MTIKEVQKLANGEKTGGFVATLKTIKKKWQSGDEQIQTAVLADKTGEILAEILLAKNQYGTDTFSRNEVLKISMAEVQQATEGTKLYVERYIRETATEPDISYNGYELPNWDKINQGKVRHGIVCSYIRAIGKIPDLSDVDKATIEKLVNYIMEGK
jgi:hypothetical protein